MPSLICSEILRRGPVTTAGRRLGLKLVLLQNTHPPRATVPSTFGQVNPASTLTRCTRTAELVLEKNLYGEIPQSGGTPRLRSAQRSGGVYVDDNGVLYYS